MGVSPPSTWDSPAFHKMVFDSVTIQIAELALELLQPFPTELLAEVRLLDL